MRLFLRSIKFLMMFIGGVFMLLAVNSFFGEASIWKKTVGFIVGVIPGLALMLIVHYFWCKEKILGNVLLSTTGGMILYFFIFENFPKSLVGLFLIIPVFIGGIIFKIVGKNKQKGCCKI